MTASMSSGNIRTELHHLQLSAVKSETLILELPLDGNAKADLIKRVRRELAERSAVVKGTNSRTKRRKLICDDHRFFRAQVSNAITDFVKQARERCSSLLQKQSTEALTHSLSFVWDGLAEIEERVRKCPHLSAKNAQNELEAAVRESARLARAIISLEQNADSLKPKHVLWHYIIEALIALAIMLLGIPLSKVADAQHLMDSNKPSITVPVPQGRHQLDCATGAQGCQHVGAPAVLPRKSVPQKPAPRAQGDLHAS